MTYKRGPCQYSDLRLAASRIGRNKFLLCIRYQSAALGYNSQNRLGRRKIARWYDHHHSRRAEGPLHKGAPLPGKGLGRSSLEMATTRSALVYRAEHPEEPDRGPIFGHLWATLEEEELSWATH